MAKMLKVRRQLRAALHEAIKAGDGSNAVIHKITRDIMEADVTLRVLMDSLVLGEANKATAQLRREFGVESVDTGWVTKEMLSQENVEIISARRFKRVRGECQTEIDLAHTHGMTEEASVAIQIIGLLDKLAPEPSDDAEAVDAVADKAKV